MVTILKREFDISARKTLQVLGIALKHRKPKEEQVTVIQELAPFVDLCGIDPGVQQPKERREDEANGNLIHRAVLHPSVISLSVVSISSGRFPYSLLVSFFH